MKVALLSAGCAFIGLILSITPIPFLPKIYCEGFVENWKQRESVGWIIFYGIIGLPWALLPIAFIIGVYGTSGLIPSIFFSLGMYGALIVHLASSNDDDNIRPSE